MLQRGDGHRDYERGRGRCRLCGAAGNNGTNAERSAPANHPDVITVSALADFDGIPATSLTDLPTDQDDTLADFKQLGRHG